MQTNKQLIYIHDSQTGSFTLDKGQNIKPYQSKICVPKGTQVQREDESHHWIRNFDFVESYYHHDLKHRGINIPKEFIEPYKTLDKCRS